MIAPTLSNLEVLLASLAAKERGLTRAGGDIVLDPPPTRESALGRELLAGLQPVLRAAWRGAVDDGSKAHWLVAHRCCGNWSLSALAPGQLAKSRCRFCHTKYHSERLAIPWAGPVRRGRPVHPDYELLKKNRKKLDDGVASTTPRV